MSDEFDDVAWHAAGRPAAAPAQRATPARLVSRLYRASGQALRAKILACLLRPLGPLGLAAVAAGAFAQFASRRGLDSLRIDDVAGYTSDQVLELARFVQEVNPDALQQVVGLLADNAFNVAAFSAAVALLLYRRLRSPAVRADDDD